MNGVVFFIGGKEHHFKTINIIKKQHLITKIFFKISELSKVKNSFIFTIGVKVIPENIILETTKNNNFLLNLHSGDTRKYRGMDCEYWSLFYNDDVICTLHKLDKKIDGGIIYTQNKVDLENVQNTNQLKLAIADSYASIINTFLENPEYYINNCKNKGTGKYYKSMKKNILNIINKKLEKGDFIT